MDDLDAVWQAIDTERARLADLLDGLSDAEWEAPSLCEGWRMRDVVAHLTLAHMRPSQVLVEVLRARGIYDRMVHDSAVRTAAAPTKQLVAQLRMMIGSRRKVLGISAREPLIDVLVHEQDIALPLGLVLPMPLWAATEAANRVWNTPWPLTVAFHVRRRLRGMRLVADDVEWAAGAGAVVEGPVEALLLLMTGRIGAARDRLRGPGAALLPQAA
jgi:uncharacterized protein (TIGR03083 family)